MKTLKEKFFELQAEHRDKKDKYNPVFTFQCTSTEILTALARGEINAEELVAIELMNRGYDADGNWIGFEDAEEYWTERNAK